MGERTDLDTTGVGRPPRILSLLQMLVGIVAVALAVGSIPANYESARGIIDGFFDFADRTDSLFKLGTAARIEDYPESIIWMIYMVALGFFLTFIFYTFYNIAHNALHYLKEGFQNSTGEAEPVVNPAVLWSGAGADQAEEEESVTAREVAASKLMTQLRERNINAYKSPPADERIQQFIQRFFGENIKYLSPIQRDIVMTLGRALRRRFNWFVISIALLAIVVTFVDWMSSQTVSSIIPYADKLHREERRVAEIILSWFRDEDVRGAAIIPFFWLVGLQIMLGLTQFLSIRSLTPRRPPELDVRERGEQYERIEHPNQMTVRLDEVSEPLAWNGHPNRYHYLWEKPDLRSTDLRSTETRLDVSGYMLLEQYPEPTRPRGLNTAVLLMTAGWVMMLFGYYMILYELIPRSLYLLAREQDSTPFPYAPVFIMVQGYVMRATYVNGQNFAAAGIRLYNSIWYRSHIIMIDFIGKRSPKKASEKARSSTRSKAASTEIEYYDVTARFWATQLLTEAESFNAQRSLLAYEDTQESSDWIKCFRDEIGKAQSPD